LLTDFSSVCTLGGLKEENTGEGMRWYLSNANITTTSRWSKRPQMTSNLKNSFNRFETLPHKWLEIYNNKNTAHPFENHFQLLIMINKTCSLEITIDISASYILHVVIFQANFGYAYLQCIKCFLLTNKFISVFPLRKSSFERVEQLSLSFSWRETYEKMNKLRVNVSKNQRKTAQSRPRSKNRFPSFFVYSKFKVLNKVKWVSFLKYPF